MGKLYSIYTISTYDLMNKDLRVSDFIERHKYKILNFLPDDTEYLGHECNQTINLSSHAQIVLLFQHPVFKDGTSIDLEFTRAAYLASENSSITQFADLITGVTYTLADGTKTRFIGDKI